jgi:hypothetical protein
MFFFKKKKVVVDCFTKFSPAYEYHPISRAIKTTPTWWDELPSKIDIVNSLGINLPSLTMKSCNGFVDLYRKSFIISMWSDLVIKTSSDGAWSYQYALDAGVAIQSHSRDQYGSEFDGYVHLKLTTPWCIKEKTGVQFYLADATWNRIKHINKWFTPPGVLDFKYHTTNNINMFVNKVDNQFMINAGQPMMMATPLSEHNVEIKNHLIDASEYDKMKVLSVPNTFIGSYNKHKKIIDSKPKCPFGFK